METHKTKELQVRMFETTRRIMQETFVDSERAYVTNLLAARPEPFPGFANVCAAQAEFHPRKPLENTVFYITWATGTMPDGTPLKPNAPKDIIVTVAGTHDISVEPVIEYSVQLNGRTDQLTVKQSAKQRERGEKDSETIETLLRQLDTKCHERSLVKAHFKPALGEQERVWTADL